MVCVCLCVCVCAYILVLYVAELGNKTLDYTVLRSRREIYCLENRDKCGGSEDSIDEDMDDTLQFYPEIVFHRVFSIVVGKEILLLFTAAIMLCDEDGECLLKGTADGGFLVKGFSGDGNDFMCYGGSVFTLSLL